MASKNESFRVNESTVKQLQDYCREHNITGFSKKKKKELQLLIRKDLKKKPQSIIKGSIKVKTLHSSIDGIKAPKGWMFQDNSIDFVALLKISKIGKWRLDLKKRGNPKDAYICAFKIDDPKTPFPYWHISGIHPRFGNYPFGAHEMSYNIYTKPSKKVSIELLKWAVGIIEEREAEENRAS